MDLRRFELQAECVPAPYKTGSKVVKVAYPGVSRFIGVPSGLLLGHILRQARPKGGFLR